jgi:hypothetical protein
MIIKIKEGGETFYYKANSKEDAVINHIKMFDNEITKADIDEVTEISEIDASKMQTVDEFGVIINLLQDSKSTTDIYGLIGSTIY